MRKRFALAIIMFVAIMSFSATITHSHAFKSPDIQENTVTISSVSIDNFSSNDDGKSKISLMLFSITMGFIVLRVFINNIEVDKSFQKFIWLTPIFYQSNYVVKAL